MTDRVSVWELSEMDIRQLWMVNVVAFVNCQNEIAANNKTRLKNGK